MGDHHWREEGLFFGPQVEKHNQSGHSGAVEAQKTNTGPREEPKSEQKSRNDRKEKLDKNQEVTVP